MATSNNWFLTISVYDNLYVYVCTNSYLSARGDVSNLMIGDFHVIFADGTSANGSFGLRYANVSFSTGEKVFLTMTESTIWSRILHVSCTCSDPRYNTGHALFTFGSKCWWLYRIYSSRSKIFVPKCPESLDDPGLEIETVKRMKSNRIKMYRLSKGYEESEKKTEM